MEESKKKYLFKIWWTEMPTYREVTLSAKSDEEAKELVAKEFHKDPYMYPFKSDMKDLPKRMFRITYEIEGGKTYELKTEDPPGHEQITKVGSGS